MNPCPIILAVSLLSCKSVSVGATTLFGADFEQDRSLKGWVSAIDPGVTPPDTAFGVVASEVVGDRINYFYRGLNNSFGVSAALGRPYKVNGETASIEIRLRVRCNGDATPVSVDLSSRESPAFPFQFSAGKGSGFGAGGYQHANEANKLYFYKDTGDPVAYGEKKPFVPDEKGWHSWRLIYDRTASTLALFVDDAEEPAVVQKNVELEGTVFRSLWFMGSGSGVDYDDIVVNAADRKDGTGQDGGRKAE